MGQVIGDLLPLAVGNAISPIPIIAAILMLLSPKAGAASTGFLVGWLVGILVGCGVFVLIAEATDMGSESGTSETGSWVKLVLGLLLIAASVRQWHKRPREGEEPHLPAWMRAIDSMTAGKALGLGFLLAAVNPKNLVMCIGAGVVIGTGDLSTGENLVAVLVFTVLSGVSVAAPVIGFAVAGDRMTKPLQELREGLVGNNVAVMSVLLLVIGAVLAGKGLGGLSS